MATAETVKDAGPSATPAYLPFQTFTNFIEKLKATTVPPAIDKSILGNMAGGVQSHLLVALRFLGLTEGKSNTVTSALEKLVESCGTEGYKGTLKSIVLDAYADIIGDMNIANATYRSHLNPVNTRSLSTYGHPIWCKDGCQSLLLHGFLCTNSA